MDNIPEGAIPVDSSSEQTPPPGSIPIESAPPPGSIPVDQEAPAQQDNSSMMDTAKAFAEGAGRGASFGTSTLAEEAAGVGPEEIKARKEQHPVAAALGDVSGTIGSLLIPGVGEGWLLAKGAKVLLPVAAEMNAAAKAGRLALRGLIETTGMAAGSEIGDALLNDNKPAETVAKHIAYAGALGFLTGGIGSAASQALESTNNIHLGNYLDDWAIGLDKAAKGPEAVEAQKAIYSMIGDKLPKGQEHAIKFYQETSKDIAKTIADATVRAPLVATGYLEGGAPGALGTLSASTNKLANKWLQPYSDKLASQIRPMITKNAVPVMLRAITTGKTSGITNAISYGAKAITGDKMINDAIGSLFKVGGNKAINIAFDQNENDKLDDQVKNNVVDKQLTDLQQDSNTQNYATGGTVSPGPSPANGMETLYPSANIVMNAAKARTFNYLNSIRPQPDPNMKPFDTVHKDHLKEKNYQEALTIANKPLTVLQHLQKGTLKLSHMQHLTSMYPELHSVLAKKITQHVMSNNIKDERPGYKTRQNLSLFLGSPLDSTMTPSSIQAAQSVFAPKAVPGQQPQEKPKKGTSTLGKFSKDYQTPEQARAARANKS